MRESWLTSLNNFWPAIRDGISFARGKMPRRYRDLLMDDRDRL